MSDIMNELQNMIDLVQMNMPLLLTLLGIIWGIHLVNFILGYNLNVFGIHPRRVSGLIGIFFAPFLHGNFNHLFFNSIPLFVLAALLMLHGIPVFICASAIIIVFGGLGTWLFARRAVHVGASGLIVGYWSFLVTSAYYQRSAMAIILGFVSVYYFGGLFFSILPGEKGVSWESHFFGFLAGIAAYFTLPWALYFYYLQFN